MVASEKMKDLTFKIYDKQLRLFNIFIDLV